VTFNELCENTESLNDDAIVNKLKKAFITYLDRRDVEDMRGDLEDGAFNLFTELEDNDAFGTEGMRL